MLKSTIFLRMGRVTDLPFLRLTYRITRGKFLEILYHRDIGERIERQIARKFCWRNSRIKKSPFCQHLVVFCNLIFYPHQLSAFLPTGYYTPLDNRYSTDTSVLAIILLDNRYFQPDILVLDSEWYFQPTLAILRSWIEWTTSYPPLISIGKPFYKKRICNIGNSDIFVKLSKINLRLSIV